MAVKRIEVGLLPLVLPGNPARPLNGEAGPEDLFELRCEITLAALAAFVPLHHLFRSVLITEIADKTGAVEIGIGADLEIDRCPLRFEPDHIVKRGPVANHGAEDHLVIVTLCPSQTAGQPGLHENGNALEVPARGQQPWCGEIGIDERDRILRGVLHLAAKKRAKKPVAAGRLVGGDDVHGLMIHQPVHALICRRGLVDIIVGSELHADKIARYGDGAGIAVIPEILQVNGGFFIAVIIENPALEAAGIQEAAREMGKDELMNPAEIDQIHTPGGLDTELAGSAGDTKCRKKKEKQQAVASFRHHLSNSLHGSMSNPGKEYLSHHYVMQAQALLFGGRFRYLKSNAKGVYGSTHRRSARGFTPAGGPISE